MVLAEESLYRSIFVAQDEERSDDHRSVSERATAFCWSRLT